MAKRVPIAAPIRVIADPKTDTLFVRFADAEIVESEEVEPGVILDYDAKDYIVGVEILHVNERLRRAANEKEPKV